MVSLDELQKKIYQNKVNKHFNVTDLYKEFCCLYGEVGEAYDAWCKKLGKEEISLELADIAIFTLGIAEILGISLEDAIQKKIAINEKRVYINGKKVEPNATKKAE